LSLSKLLALALLLPVVTLTSCSSSERSGVIAMTYDVCAPLRLVPADDASPEEVGAIDEAIEMWRSMGVTTLTRGPTLADGMPEVPIRFQKAGTLFHGLYEDSIGVVFVNRSLGVPHERAVTIAHEVGHAFGLYHVSGRVSVMNPGNLAIEPNAGDQQALATTWGACAPAL